MMMMTMRERYKGTQRVKKSDDDANDFGRREEEKVAVYRRGRERNGSGTRERDDAEPRDESGQTTTMRRMDERRRGVVARFD